MNTLSTRQSSRRRGTVTVVVAVLLMLILGMVAEYTRKAVGDRRQIRVQQQQQQTRELAQAGLLRLQQRRLQNADYAGESWQVPAGFIHQTNSASVTISVQDDTARIVARYPLEADFPQQMTLVVKLQP